MKLYQTPGGTWAGSEKDWKAAMKAEGSDPKAMPRHTVDVPTSKADLMEFLTFHNVNVLCPRGAGGRSEVAPAAGTTPAPPPGGTPVDVEALRRQHNPDAPDLKQPDMVVLKHRELDAAFEAAPLGHQLCLATVAIDAAIQQLAPR